MEKLAIKGGFPVRSSKIYYGRQWLDEADIKAVTDVLHSDFITCGPKVDEMETALCEYTGAKYAVAVNSGTSALHCACIAAGVREGDEVITTPMTFAASANCAVYCGAKPVFADIDPDTYNIDPQSIRDKITPKTKAIVAVDFTGQAVRIREIKEICNEYGLIFIEDAAHSIGSKYNGQHVGSLADMTCFSFHPVKTITGGEGGAILTNDEDLYKRLVLAHTHGITHDSSMMEGAPHEGPWYYEQISLGYNYQEQTVGVSSDPVEENPDEDDPEQDDEELDEDDSEQDNEDYDEDDPEQDDEELDEDDPEQDNEELDEDDPEQDDEELDEDDPDQDDEELDEDDPEQDDEDYDEEDTESEAFSQSM